MIASSLCNADTVFAIVKTTEMVVIYLGFFFTENQQLQREEGIEIRNMMDHKRNPCSIEDNSFTSIASKRHKADLSMTAKERKEKIGERIVALQQLVSPYGKTDTASVLNEAMEYIRFLHEQVKVLSAPYLQSSPTAKMQEVELYALRNRGLCLVPVSYTMGVARSNGADIWAPIKTTSPKFEKAISPFH